MYPLTVLDIGEYSAMRPLTGNIHGSRPNYHIPPLTKFLSFKKLTTNTHTDVRMGSVDPGGTDAMEPISIPSHWDGKQHCW